MKRIITYLAALLCICSCEMTIMDGKWDPIELDKKSVTFPQEGGQNTVSALNVLQARIDMQAGNAFTSITIYQQ